MGILGDIGSIIGAIGGLSADKKKNAQTQQQLDLERQLANQQVDISQYIQGLSKDVVGRGSGITDPYSGQTVGYDPASNTYQAPLTGLQQQGQTASDQEALARNTVDQEMRRTALQDAEKNRQMASGQVGNSINDINLFKQGVGAVDPASIASDLRLSRTGAVNAGYDDAARSASMLQARTGSSAVADALAGLGKQRANAIATTMGAPNTEALGMADDLNKSRLSQKVGLYDLFNTNANKVYDSGFTPSTAANDAYTKALQGEQLDLSRYNTAMGGSGTAAAGIGSAANGSQAAFNSAMANTVQNPFGRFAAGVGAAGDNIAKDFSQYFSGGG